MKFEDPCFGNCSKHVDCKRYRISVNPFGKSAQVFTDGTCEGKEDRPSRGRPGKNKLSKVQADAIYKIAKDNPACGWVALVKSLTMELS